MLSAKTEYACLALLQLAAAHADPCPMPVRTLASLAKIPEGFLVQILQQLKRGGLVISTRGKSGGYRLAKSPELISLGEALEILEGTKQQGSNLDEPTPLAGVLAEVCEQASQAANDQLHLVTLNDLITSATAPAEMYYI